jgi:uncharacterized delta-60 repeat protein
MAFFRIRAPRQPLSGRQGVVLILERLEERTLLSSGGLDPSFGSGGRVISDFGPTGYGAEALVRQPDGKLVVAGSAAQDASGQHFVVARYLADGSLDPTFGANGKVTTDLGLDIAHAAALQADGKIVVVGETLSNNEAQFALARYSADGILDPGFGNGGKVETSFTGGAVAFAVVAQPDGKLVVAGTGGFNSHILLARFNTDGSLDVTFGTGGLVITNAAGLEGPATLALEPNGKLVVVWTSVGRPATSEPDLGGLPVPTGSITSTFSLARYNADGTLDADFGNGGRVATSFEASYDLATGVALQSEGEIIVVGVSDAGSGPGDNYAPHFRLARYHDDGSLDAAFGNGGEVVTDIPSRIDVYPKVALETDGKIVVAGTALIGAKSDFSVSRYNTDGTPDLTFGRLGRITTAVGDNTDFANSLLIQPNGAIVVAGRTALGTGADVAFALVRYLPDATVDTSADPSQAFVVHLYEDLLGREPDQFGLGAWSALLNYGASKARVAQGILSSLEYRAREVQELYVRILHRSADTTGLNAFVKLLATNSIEQVEAVMFGSPEYLDNRAGGDNNRFLAALYEDVFGRAIDPAGQSTWGQRLTMGTKRGEVAAMILTSAEYRRDLVQEVYQRFLHRSADSNGLDAFLTALGQGTHGEDLIALVLASAEYTRRQ